VIDSTTIGECVDASRESAARPSVTSFDANAIVGVKTDAIMYALSRVALP
jgi:hypothetical protein